MPLLVTQKCIYHYFYSDQFECKGKLYMMQHICLVYTYYFVITAKSETEYTTHPLTYLTLWTYQCN